MSKKWTIDDLDGCADDRSRVTGNGLSVLVPKLFAEHIPAEADVLEPGCGLGGLYELLSPERRARMTMLDENPEAVEIVRSRHPSANVVVGNLYRLPYEDGAVGNIVFLNVLDYIDDLGVALEEAYRVLPAGGNLVQITEFAPYLRNALVKMADGQFALPVLNKASNLIGFKLVGRCAIKEHSEPAHRELTAIHTDVEESYKLLCDIRSPLLVELALLGECFETEVVSLRDSFVTRIGEYLPKAGFDIVWNGGRDVYGCPSLQLANVLPAGQGLHYDMGETKPLPVLVAGQHRMKFTFHVTVAQKP